MVAIFVLSVLIGAFAFSMKVETKLAMNANHEAELIWLGRSGVDLARYVVAQQLAIPNEPYDSLNQKWAGGPGGMNTSNSPLANISLENYQVGKGKISVKITDLERKFNINQADDQVLQQAMTVVGVDASAIPEISAAIIDWIDPDDVTRVNGAESDYYQGLDPQYYAKNKPIDDLSELLLIRGISLDMYWGSASTNHSIAAFQAVDRYGRPVQQPIYPVGLAELFTALSSGKININTASINTLRTIPLLDENAAAEIIKLRSGPDGADGTEDDTPFRNVGELVNTGLNRQVIPQISRYCDVRSRTFDVEILAEIGGYTRKFNAIIGRNSPRDVQILSFSWR
ncbi:MAG: general secretion pathway protein GspK [Verrucomicrobiota bacterium]